MVGEVTLRKATEKDSATLMEWRNSDEYREHHGSGPITKEQHDSWLEKALTSKDNLILMAEAGGKTIGVLRLDRVLGAPLDIANMRLVTLMVAPSLHYKGYGVAILKEGCTSYGQEYALLARVKRNEVAFIESLEECGFVLLGEMAGGGIGYLRHSDGAEAQTVH